MVYILISKYVIHEITLCDQNLIRKIKNIRFCKNTYESVKNATSKFMKNS